MKPTTIIRYLPDLVRALGRHASRALRTLNHVEHQHPKEPPHWYLGVLGTRTEAQGRGVGSALLAPVLEHCDTEGLPAYLESSKHANIAFYRRHGFEVTGEIPLPFGGPPVWPMWRDPRPR
jgi:ribosomal protein S18 acetylase RimI-like enzyme